MKPNGPCPNLSLSPLCCNRPMNWEALLLRGLSSVYVSPRARVRRSFSSISSPSAHRQLLVDLAKPGYLKDHVLTRRYNPSDSCCQILSVGPGTSPSVVAGNKHFSLNMFFCPPVKPDFPGSVNSKKCEKTLTQAPLL